jgi:hypothetical protein
MNTKTALIISAIIALLLLLARKAKASNSATAAGGNVGEASTSRPEGFTPELHIVSDYSFANRHFEFLTPIGRFVIHQPDLSSAAYHSLGATGNYRFGWQAVTPSRIVATLLPLNDGAVVSNVVLNFDDGSVAFEYVQL